MRIREILASMEGTERKTEVAVARGEERLN